MRELRRVQVFRLIIVTLCIAGCCRRDKWAAFIEMQIDQHECPAWISSVSIDRQDGGRPVNVSLCAFLFPCVFLL